MSEIREKLITLINHPSTNEHVREVAKSKLQTILSKSFVKIQNLQSTNEIKTNLSEKDFDKFWINDITVRVLYNRLSNLKPSPSELMFLRQGKIEMIVPPPYIISKKEYYSLIKTACPELVSINSEYRDNCCYFLLSYI